MTITALIRLSARILMFSLRNSPSLLFAFPESAGWAVVFRLLPEVRLRLFA